MSIFEEGKKRMLLDETEIKKRPPVKKKRLNLPGKIIEVVKNDTLPQSELEIYFENMRESLLKKGWCIYRRNGYLGLAGYEANRIDRISIEDRKENHIYQDYTGKNGIPKTRVYNPRDEKIVTIAKISLVDLNEQSKDRWEVTSYWTTRRNLFKDYAEAVALFSQIENRWDPGTMLWSKLAEYEYFEPY